jgi:hypothetical protein
VETVGHRLLDFNVAGMAQLAPSVQQYNQILDAHIARWQLTGGERERVELWRYHPMRRGKPPGPTRELLAASLHYDALGDYSDLRADARVTHLDRLGPGSYRVHFRSGASFGHYRLEWHAQGDHGRWWVERGRFFENDSDKGESLP